jgi:L-ribulose-5-phosphate 3-epimerase
MEVKMDKSKIVFSGNDDVYAGDIAKLVRAATQYGIDWLELWFPKTAPFESIDEVEALLISSNKKVACVTTWSHLYSENCEAEKAVLLKGIEIADRLKAPRVNTYFGHYIYNNPRRAIETYAKNIAPVLEVAAQKGLVVCLENEFDSRGQDPGYSDITRSADLMLQLMELIDSPLFKVTFDPANCYVAGEEAFPYFYNVLKKYIDYIHLKDVRKYVTPRDRTRRIWSDHERNYLFTPLGEGVMNYLGLFKALYADHYQGQFTMEPHVEKDELLYDAYEKNLGFISRCFDLFEKD